MPCIFMLGWLCCQFTFRLLLVITLWQPNHRSCFSLTHIIEKRIRLENATQVIIRQINFERCDVQHTNAYMHHTMRPHYQNGPMMFELQQLWGRWASGFPWQPLKECICQIVKCCAYGMHYVSFFWKEIYYYYIRVIWARFVTEPHLSNCHNITFTFGKGS